MKKASKRAKPARHGPVIDIHAHWFPPEWVELIEAEGNQNGARVERTEQGLSLNLLRGINMITNQHVDLDICLKAMRRQGVDMHALSPCAPMVYWAPPEFGLRLSRAFNDACSAAHLDSPDRYVGLAMLPMQAPNRCCRQRRRPRL